MASLSQKGIKPMIDSQVSSIILNENNMDIVLYKL